MANFLKTQTEYYHWVVGMFSGGPATLITGGWQP